MKGICGRCAMDMGKVSTHEQEGKHYVKFYCLKCTNEVVVVG